MEDDNNILICIFNYRHDENARNLKSALEKDFKTLILDSGNNKVCNDFIQYPNIYYSGLWNEMKKVLIEGKYSWVGIICSDITVDSTNITKLINRIKWLKTRSDIGQYQPSFDSTSYKWRDNNNDGTQNMYIKYLLDGPICFYKREIVEKYPFIDTNINLYGCGVGRCTSLFTMKLGLKNIFDCSVIVHHPKGTGYDIEKSALQGNNYIKIMCEKLKLPKEYINIDGKKNTIKIYGNDKN